MKASKHERIAQLEKAIEMVREALSHVEEAINGTGLESHFEAYDKYGFNQLLNIGNTYDSGIADLINQINNEEDQ
jgi:hypothetical protein